MTSRNLLLGAHLSIAKGLHEAVYAAARYGSSTLQIFTKNASTWKEKALSETDIQKFKAACQDTGIHEIAAHTSYLINMAGSDTVKTEKSKSALAAELIRSDKLGIPYVVLHPGSHKGEGEAAAVERIISRLNAVFSETRDASPRLLLETTAGQGACIGHRFEHLAAIMRGVTEPDRLGICLDTCHIFAAGYDISTPSGYRETMAEFDAVIGLEHLYVIHLNDAKRGAGSLVDRHAHIGDGHIGLTGFKSIINDTRLEEIPKIIETPKKKNGEDADSINLALLRRLKTDG
jgi:deoxyribonuclease-4